MTLRRFVSLSPATQEITPDWSPSGDRILLSFREVESDIWQIGTIDTDGGPVTNISSGRYSEFLDQW